MAHECPECGYSCHCGGDIECCNYGYSEYAAACSHCDGLDYSADDDDHWDWGDPYVPCSVKGCSSFAYNESTSKCWLHLVWYRPFTVACGRVYYRLRAALMRFKRRDDEIPF